MGWRALAVPVLILAFVLSCRAQDKPPVEGKAAGTPEAAGLRDPAGAGKETAKPAEEKGTPAAAASGETDQSQEETKAEGALPPEAARQEEKLEKKNGYPFVVLETSMGNIKLELYPDKTPVTVENFLKYVKDNFYGGTIFHRVVRNFVIQGGGFDADLAQIPNREPIINEAQSGISNKRGTICMARTRDRNSATSQFYINLRDNTMLDYRDETPGGWGYTAFGKVTEGMDVVDKIGAVETGSKGPFPKEVPQQTVTILKAYVVE